MCNDIPRTNMDGQTKLKVCVILVFLPNVICNGVKMQPIWQGNLNVHKCTSVLPIGMDSHTRAQSQHATWLAISSRQ